MRKILLTVLLSAFWLSSSQAIELRLMTGSEQGTYYQIGQETSKATDRTGIHLQVLPSQGSWENIVALYNGDTEFAILQVDAFMQAAKNLYRNTAVKIDEEIRVVMPLYREEIHVIKALGRELDFVNQESFLVGCGKENSGSCLTAAVLEDVYGKQFKYLWSDYETAFANLKRGALDLVIITAGKPYPLLVEQSGLEIVSLPRFEKVTEFYSRAKLGPQDYPWMEGEVDTYSVRSVLATMIQEEEGLANDLVGSVHFALRVNEAELKKSGHSKWDEVLFNGYINGLSHAGALRSLNACNAIKGFGYQCTDMVSVK